MNIFAGFGKLGYACLKELYEQEIPIDFILTHSDGSEISVDSFAKMKQIECSYSDLRKDQEQLDHLLKNSIEYLISVNYRYILPNNLLTKSKYPLNLHGSLLPKYRGRTPHVWAIINGENQTGITCHIMDKSVDTGDIYHQEVVPIDNDDTGGSIIQKFEKLYPQCLVKTLNKISSGYRPEPQDDSQATYFGKRIPEMGYIDFTKDRESLINFIRAQSRPYPGAYCFLPSGAKLIVHKASIIDRIENINIPIGSVIKYNSNYLARVNSGYIQLTDYEIEK